MAAPAKKAPAKRAPAKAAPKQAAPTSPDPLADIPVELQFSSDSGTRRDPETMEVAIDGQAFTLTQPSTALMHLLAGAFSVGADDSERVRAMMQLVNVSIDAGGRLYLNHAMSAQDNSFDDGLLGDLTATILNRWAPTLAEEAEQLKRATPNRADRRQAARK